MPQTLRELRAMRGLTQQQLADATGFRQVQISFWETGRSPMRPLTQARLARFFGVPMSEIAVPRMVLVVPESSSRPGESETGAPVDQSDAPDSVLQSEQSVEENG